MEKDTNTVNTPKKGYGKGRWLALAGTVLLAVGILAFWGWQKLAGPPADLSGVWVVLGGNTTLVLEKQGEDYRLSLGGRRLTVKDVAPDHAKRQLNLTVRTDSGLLAVWSLHMGQEGEDKNMLYLNQDGLPYEAFVLQRQLTAADRARLAAAKPAKKPLWSPSFDCGRATTDVERLICSDRGLAELDQQIADYVADGAAEDKAIQQRWRVNDRDRCTTIDCLRQIQLQRLEDLQRMKMNAAQYEEEGESEEASIEAAPAADIAAQAAP